MLDKASDNPGQKPVADAAALQSLRNEIAFHRRQDKSRSVLARATGWVWERCQKIDHSALSLQSFYKQAEGKLKSGNAETVARIKREIDARIEQDKQALESRETFSQYAGGFCKTAALFMRKSAGVIGTIGIYGLDQWKPGETLRNQFLDAGMGALKGGGTKLLFHFMGHRLHAPAKGVALGVGNTSLDMLLSRGTYRDGVARCLGNSILAVFDGKARALDGAVFALSEGTFLGLNYASRGAVSRSPLFSTMLTGMSFGASSGAAGEYMRQQKTGKPLNFKKIVEHAALQGLLDTGAASLGGVQSLHIANKFNPNVRTYLALRGLEQFQGLRGGQQDETALLRVREVQGTTWYGRLKLPGETQSLLLGHNSMQASWRLQSAGDADAIACCFPQLLPPLLRDKHIMPAAGRRLRVDQLPGDKIAGGYLIRIVPADVRCYRDTRTATSIVLSGGHGGGHADGPTNTGGEPGWDVDALGHGAPTDPVSNRSAAGRVAPSDKLPARTAWNVPRELIAAARTLNDLAKHLCHESGAAAERQAIIDHLLKNPELLMPVQSKSGVLGSPAAELCRIMGNPEKLQAAMQAAQKAIAEKGAAEQATKEAAERAARREKDSNEREWNLIEIGYLPCLAQYADKVSERINNNPEMRRRLDEFASKSKDRHLVSQLDGILGTRYAEALKAKVIRTLNSADLSEQQQAVKELAGELDAISTNEFLRWMKAAAAPESVDVLARGLQCKNPARVGETVNALSTHLGMLSDESFLLWRQAAERSLPDGRLLRNNQAVMDALPLPVQKLFLSKMANSQEKVPDWAGDYVEISRERLAEQKKQVEERGQRWKQPWTPSFKDYLDARIELLCRVMGAMETVPFHLSPELQLKLIALGATDKGGLVGVLDAIGHREIFINSGDGQRGKDRQGTGTYEWTEGDPRVEANRMLLAELLPQAGSMEPLKYMFQFLRERNYTGALAAAELMKPAAITPDAQQNWDKIQDILGDITKGRLRSPRREPYGGAGKKAQQPQPAPPQPQPQPQPAPPQPPDPPEPPPTPPQSIAYDPFDGIVMPQGLDRTKAADTLAWFESRPAKFINKQFRQDNKVPGLGQVTYRQLYKFLGKPAPQAWLDKQK